MNARLLFLLALLPLLAAAAGTATVRVTNAGAVPITVEDRTIRPSATTTIFVLAGRPGALAAAAPDGFGLSSPASYPALREGSSFSLRLSAERGAEAVPPPAPSVSGPIPASPPRTPHRAVAPRPASSAPRSGKVLPAILSKLDTDGVYLEAIDAHAFEDQKAERGNFRRGKTAEQVERHHDHIHHDRA